jgi:hypothetical protein
MGSFRGFKHVSADAMVKNSILAFWYLCRSGESRKLLFDHVVQYKENKIQRQRVTFVEPKTGSKRRPDQFVSLDAHSSPHVCPVHTFNYLKAARVKNQRHVFSDKKGRALSAGDLNSDFAAVIKAWREENLSVPKGKITWHVWRISGIGFYAIDLNLSIIQIQSISRHRWGSSVTRDIYLAKSAQRINEKTASQIATLLSKGIRPGTSDSILQRDAPWMHRLPPNMQKVFHSWINPVSF